MVKTVVYSDENHTTRYSTKSLESDAINHRAGEYVRGTVHTNTIEGCFAILKRGDHGNLSPSAGIMGTYHHVSQQHLKRYLAEFDFCYANRIALNVDDAERTIRALLGAKGKRLTYSPAANLATQA